MLLKIGAAFPICVRAGAPARELRQIKQTRAFGLATSGGKDWFNER